MTPDQKGQVRKDLVDLQAAVQKACSSSLVPDHLKAMATLSYRLLETLAIEQGAFDESEASHG